ncbi:TetR/AcrR family transcriptional regulator [Corynebacterium sp. Q4381]|uniref:TetR/AcrR family transcriptional regulator n=1 Tax=Corynebacterium sp. Marseille-Q4381 TaxID=3121597 RepID=UPI002FE51C42
MTHGSAEPSPEEAVAVALAMFARDGYEGTKLDAVARACGVSKRMLHYHFGNKAGLYQRALSLAMERVAPPERLISRNYAVPVEGMRRFVDATFHSFRDHPECVRLLLRENLDPTTDVDDSGSDAREHSVLLHLERILMQGQDAGAFRPGISADDVLALTVSLCEFQVAHTATAYTVSRIKVDDPRNVEGLRRLVIDTVLAFLTSHIPHSGYDSYLVSEPAPETIDVADIY